MIFIYHIQKLPKFDDCIKGIVGARAFTKEDLEAILRGILIYIRGKDSQKAFGTEILSYPLLRTQFRSEATKDKTSFLYKFTRESEQKSYKRYDGILLVEPYYGEIDFSSQFLAELIEQIIKFRKDKEIALLPEHNRFLNSLETCIEIDNYFITSGFSDLFNFEITVKRSPWFLKLLEIFLNHFSDAISAISVNEVDRLVLLFKNKEKEFLPEREFFELLTPRKNKSDLTPLFEKLAGSLVFKKLIGKSISSDHKIQIDSLIENIALGVKRIEQIEDDYQQKINKFYSEILDIFKGLDIERENALNEIEETLSLSSKNVKKIHNILTETEIDIISKISKEQKDKVSIPRWQDILPMPNENILKLLSGKKNQTPISDTDEARDLAALNKNKTRKSDKAETEKNKSAVLDKLGIKDILNKKIITRIKQEMSQRDLSEIAGSLAVGIPRSKQTTSKINFIEDIIFEHLDKLKPNGPKIIPKPELRNKINDMLKNEELKKDFLRIRSSSYNKTGQDLYFIEEELLQVIEKFIIILLKNIHIE